MADGWRPRDAEPDQCPRHGNGLICVCSSGRAEVTSRDVARAAVSACLAACMSARCAVPILARPAQTHGSERSRTPRRTTRVVGGGSATAQASRDVMTERPSTDPSRAWVAALRGPTGARQEATADLHALLTRGARFALSRSHQGPGEIPSDEVDALATQAADAALCDVVASLDSFRGRSRFTTWASKFAIREAGVTRAAGSSLPRSAASDPLR